MITKVKNWQQNMEDRDSIDQLISTLDIENWEKAGSISNDFSPKYTIELYHDTEKQDTNNDIEEITIYGNGEYASIFITSPGGAKQNYKTNIDVSDLIDTKTEKILVEKNFLFDI